MISKERIKDNFLEFAVTDSPSLKEGKIAEIINRHLDKLGFEHYEDDAKARINGECGNIICSVKGKPGLPSIIVSAHMDTVQPCLGKKPIVEGDIIRSDGTTVLGGDDHAGVAVIIELLYALKEDRPEHGDITAIFTVGEEIGLLGAKNLDYKSIKADYGFVFDDSGEIGTVVYKAPSYNGIKATITGKAAHAGVEPEKGISAIVVASHAISSMKTGRIDEYTTANIGVIKGGTATNIVCDTVEILAEVRSLKEDLIEKQTEHMKKCFEDAAQKFGAKVELSITRDFSSYNIERDHSIMRILEKAASRAGFKLILETSGGGSDTNIFNQNGIPSVNVSVGMSKVHTVEEYISVNDMVKSAEFLYEMVKSVG